MVAIVAWAITQRGEEGPWQCVIMAFDVTPYLGEFFWTKELVAPRVTRVVYEVAEDQGQLLSRQHYGEIEDGMSPEQVREIFGTRGPGVESLEPDESYELVWKMSRKEISVKFKGESSVGKSAVNEVSRSPLAGWTTRSIALINRQLPSEP